MPNVDQKLKIVVDVEGEEGTRSKEYGDHSPFLRDLRGWREYAENNDLRFEEKTVTRLTIGDKNGPLFSQSDD